MSDKNPFFIPFFHQLSSLASSFPILFDSIQRHETTSQNCPRIVFSWERQDQSATEHTPDLASVETAGYG